MAESSITDQPLSCSAQQTTHQLIHDTIVRWLREEAHLRVDEIDYDVDPALRDSFLESVRPFLPFLAADDLVPDMSGIRPKLSGPGEAARDFHIAHEGERGAPGFFNLAGIESPGLTAAPAIGRYVTDLISSYLD